MVRMGRMRQEWLFALAAAVVVGCGGGGPGSSMRDAASEARAETGETRADAAEAGVAEAGADSTTDVPRDGGSGDASDASDAAPDASDAAPDASDAAPDASDAAPDASDVAPDASDAAPAASIALVEPAAAITYVSASVHVKVVASPAMPATVDILIDDQVRASYAPPFERDVSTALIAEGTHTLGCRATIAGVQVSCAPRTLVVDRTPPVVTSTTPFDNAYAAPAEAITATFSEPIVPASILADAVVDVFADGARLSRSLSLSADGKTLTATLAAAHPPIAQGLATIKATVTDLAGNAMRAPKGWSWRWSSIVGLGPALAATAGMPGASDPAIVIDGSGAPIVAWSAEGTTGAPNQIVVQKWNGTRWAALGTFPDTVANTNFLQREADLIVTPAGLPIVAWTDQDTMNGPFATRVRAWNGTGWDAWDGLPAGSSPHLVVDDASNVSLAMTVNAPTAHAAVFRRQQGAWQPLGDLAIPSDARLSATPFMAGDGSGVLELVWSDQVGNTQFVPRRRRWTAGAWQDVAPPASGPGGPLALRVAMNRAGATAFAWDELQVPMPSVAAVFVPGWSARRLVDGFAAVGTTDIAVDATGAPVTAFQRVTPRTLQVERWSGSAWEALFDAVQVSAIPERPPLGKLAFDPTSGTPYLAVQERAGGHPQVYVLSVVR